jgi:casein kinase II subunit alpha
MRSALFLLLLLTPVFANFGDIAKQAAARKASKKKKGGKLDNEPPVRFHGHEAHLKCTYYCDAASRADGIWANMQPWEYRFQARTFDEFEFSTALSHGAYSEVFVGREKASGQRVAIKVLTKATKEDVATEVYFLHRMADVPDVLPLVAVLREGEGGVVESSSQSSASDPYSLYKAALVMPFVHFDDYKTVYPQLPPATIRRLMRKLLLTLDATHSRGIMHLDLKPINVLLDVRYEAFDTIDWGLAKLYRPGASYSYHVGTRLWKSPEILLGARDYFYAADIWSAGVMFGGMLFGESHLFGGRSNRDVLVDIVDALCPPALLNYVERMNITLSASWVDRTRLESRSCETFAQRAASPEYADRAHFFTPEALEVLERMLTFDPEERISAAAALELPYFAPYAEVDEEAAAKGRQARRAAAAAEAAGEREESDVSTDPKVRELRAAAAYKAKGRRSGGGKHGGEGERVDVDRSGVDRLRDKALRALRGV